MKKNFTIICLCILLMSCKNNNNQTEETMEPTQEFAIAETSFGTIDSTGITQYTLSNPSGMKVSIINYGGTITEIITPDKNGEMGDVVLGYKSIDGFLQKENLYFGGLIGRFGNRIANGKFTLDGKEYQLAQNNNGNTLHGGEKGFDKVIWTAEHMPGDSSLKLTYISKDGEESYPGNLSVQVIYTLTTNDELRLDYTATTDQSTPINLTSHAYFNLSAGSDATILNHELFLNADKYTPVNNLLIPTGNIANVQGSPMDFTRSKLIGSDIAKVPGGYDHNWVLKKTGNELSLAARLQHQGSGRKMEVYTTEPAIQFYSGNFLDGKLKDTKSGTPYVKHAALCLEAQHYPDSPNQPSFPNTILKPGETYRQTTVYKFGVGKE